MSVSASSPFSTRRYDLDWIRVIAFFLLILYHVGMFYVPWDWHVKSPHTVPALEPIMMLTSPWRLTLLFLVSGAATRFLADKMVMDGKMAVGALTRARVARLLPPLLLAIFVIVPPQSFFEIVEKVPDQALPYAAFYLKYVTGSGHWCRGTDCLATPTYNHMWFVAYLLAYTLVLCGLLAVGRELLRRLERGMEWALGGWRLLVLPLLFLGLIRYALLDRFPMTHWIVNDWYDHALSFSAFLFGFLMAKSETLRQGFLRLRWPALLVALPAYAIFATYAWAYRADDAVPPEALRAVMRFVYAADQWAAIAAVLGFGARHLTRDSAALRYLVPAVFPFYLVHQTATVVLGHYLAKAGLPQGLEAPLLILGTFATCLAVYEAVRRVNPLRPWFGLKPTPAGRLEAQAQAA
ncbi:acyltransferase family protein [Nitrospirillum amazonense]|uniref:Peptidoglycan/LPS O-acetylase OafA/YrhL n=1 Tax=Nitrospirillum amazonense TaxID=28077 RepID=A0A560K9D0_9PROT|nr:acyltransferase family protein [Nitrospirillum amazonense]MDG3441576.1 acyltransferase family protein [Nitrospirillum amazonense]TWB79931.1 peptidoglycan/LPS O-acetylase OafA/YrhL [Nitrospirillum amazonense]